MNKKTLVSFVGILIILGIGGFVFLQQKNKEASLPVSPEIKKMQQEVIANCKYDADFCKYAANGIVAMSGGYTMTSESTFDGKKSKMVMKSDGKENSESTTYTDGKEGGSFVSLNKSTYMKNSGEKEWTEFPPTKDEAGKPTTNLFDFESLKKELGNVTKEIENSLLVKKIGTEPCGKLTCTIFEITEKVTNFTTKIWVDTTNFYARKMESKMQQGISTMTFDYGPVTITKPSPVRKMPTFDSSALQNSGATMSAEEIKNLMKNVPGSANGSSPAVEETPAEN